MSIGEQFLGELILESEVTRKYLASVPFDKAEFKPAEKSEKLGRLAIHLAEIYGWWSICINKEKLDFEGFEPEKINNTEELMGYFDRLFNAAKVALMKVEDSELDKPWSMTYGEQILFTQPKKQVMRVFCLNHMIHHRAQLGVYLRMLDVAVPATYGPSADDENVTLVKQMDV